jgi:hypothetical protein
MLPSGAKGLIYNILPGFTKPGEVGKVKRADVYLEVRKRREHTYLNETSACVKACFIFKSLKRKQPLSVRFILI